MRDWRTPVVILILVLVLAFAVCEKFRKGKVNQGVKDPQAVALAKLRAESKQPPKINFEAGIPRFVSVQVPVSKDAPDDPVARALDFLELYRDLYRIAEPRAQLYLEHSVTSETGQHIFFGQRRDDFPVFGAQLAVHLSQDAVIATNGNYLTDIPHVLPPALDEKRAETIALKDMGENAQRIGRPKLVYFNRRLFMTPPEIASSELDVDTHQAWRLTVVQTTGNQAYSYFIDAQTGVVLFRLNLSPSHAPQKDFEILTENDAGPALFCGHAKPTNWFDENGVLLGAMPDPEGNSAFSFTHQVYDFFFKNLHRHSWGGNDNTIRVVLDDGGTTGTGNFIAACGHITIRNNMVMLDLMAHEMTHGVTSTCAGGGLFYASQPGALNESYSDVFASLVDGNWTIGETLGTFRSLLNPPAFCHPDHVTPSLSGEGLVNVSGVPCATDSAGAVIKGLRVLPPGQLPNTAINDDGFVHINSGIPNKVAFLIANGGTHNTITVSGIGGSKTAQLYYEVLTSWLTNNAEFNSARSITITVAQIWAATGKHGFTAADACVVGNAFASAGLGLPDLDCDRVDDLADPDDDGDTIPDNLDNCPRVANPGQLNSDVPPDNMGDACDLDADNDGRPNTNDNCPLKANANQADKDSDGIGDVCDDSDSDGWLDSVDNCPFHKNPSQENKFDTDSTGDACDADMDDDGICNEVGPTYIGTSGGPPCPKPDNCPGVKNSAQLDVDRDGYGDACDSCPGTPNTGLDTENDGIDDACDPDDDNDGKLDANDNCPTVSNPDQRDFNGNGKGAACDPDENVRVGVPHQILGALQFRRDHFDRYQILLRPDICPGANCRPAEFFNLFAEVKVQMEIDLPMRIVDDQGFVIAQSEHGLEKVLRFRPEPDFFYLATRARPNVSGGTPDLIKPYQGRQYFLEIVPSREVEFGRPYKISIEATSGIQR